MRARAAASRAAAFVPAAMIAVLGWSRRWVDEDAFINFRVVEQLVHGNGPVFNIGERIEAYTSPLWLAVLTVIRVTVGLISLQWSVVIIGLAISVAAFAVAGAAASRLHPGATAVPVGLLAVAAVPVVWDFATSGLEIGPAWLWLAGCWWLLLRRAQSASTPSWRERVPTLMALGVGPLVRPDLATVTLCVLLAWSALTWRGWRPTLADWAIALSWPIAYQLFRMAYFASLVPSTALAKDAGGLHLGQGWRYVLDLDRPYWLWMPGLVVLAAYVWLVRNRPRREVIATAGLVVGGLLHSAYIVAIGGDYMHGRLLLPSLFAVFAPASIGIVPGTRRARAWAVAAVAAAGAWSVVCAGWLRYRQPAFLGMAPISDWRVLGPRPFVNPVQKPAGFLTGTQVGELYEQGARGSIGLLGERVIAGDPDRLVWVVGSIGLAGYDAGIDVWVVDIGGLAEPLAAHTEITPGRPAGHRKDVDGNWYTARFGVPALQPDEAKVAAARAALQCGALRQMLAAIDEPLTLGRLFSNIVHSPSYTRLSIPADPLVAERVFCGGG